MRTLATFMEDPVSVRSSYMVANNVYKLSSEGFFHEHSTQVVHRHIQAGQTPTNTKELFENRKCKALG